MSVATLPVETSAGSNGARPWGLWRRQVAALIRLELRRTLRSRRAWPAYFLALVPVLLLAAIRTELPHAQLSNVGQVHEVYANVFQGLLLMGVVFFGALQIFMNLFRGEVIDRSLHYAFLAPVRREVLVVGKYLGGLLVATVLFVASTIVSYLIVFTAVPGFAVFGATSLGYLATYAGAAALGVVGYGALFLLVGLFFRNPVLPALVLYGWEWANFLMPPFLKRLSVVHYLKSLCPVSVSEGPFALIAEPPRPVASVVGLLVLSLALVAVAAVAIRRVEVTYSDE